jgi:hypothetical protein
MIPYEELVAALDRYVARKSGAPIPTSAASIPAPSRAAAATPAYAAPAPARAPAFDEEHDPDLPPLQHEDADSTHVGSSPSGARPQTLDDHEIDIGDVLSDEEL